MRATNHIITGTIIGFTIHQPVLAIPIAFLSHFVLDALPHYGEKKPKLRSLSFSVLLLLDMFFGFTLLLLLAVIQPDHWRLLITCGVVAASPDLMWLPDYIRAIKKIPRKSRNLLMQFHGRIQQFQRPKILSAIMEFAWFSICVLIIARWF